MKGRRTLLAALLVVMVLCAQVMGMQRGFICDCGGAARLTMSDHCHGPHEHDCEEEEHETLGHGRHDHDEGEPLHEHPALIETLQAEKAPAPSFVPAALEVVVLLSRDTFFVAGLALVPAGPFHPPREKARAGPLWPPRLSHAIALRI